MPTYDYLCNNCETEQEIVKPVEQYNKEERCKDCNCVLSKKFSSKIGLRQTAVQEKYFSHVHGQVVDGKIHEAKLAKEKGWVEIGNERPEKHLKPHREEYEF